VARVPAADIEHVVVRSLNEHLKSRPGMPTLAKIDRCAIAETIDRIDVHEDRLAIRLKSKQSQGTTELADEISDPADDRLPSRDAIGAMVRAFHDGITQTRMVKSGSSYLSQSELPLTFGVGLRDRVDRVVVTWPSGRTEEAANVATGRAYDWVEGRGLISPGAAPASPSRGRQSPP